MLIGFILVINNSVKIFWIKGSNVATNITWTYPIAFTKNPAMGIVCNVDCRCHNYTTTSIKVEFTNASTAYFTIVGAGY